ncbi:hypothetical protein B0H10DRAFT_2217177 [Mycena sp. CBHHK59/15]|nr:hypothetical protein B0H10DRAFT_2217177 [Mycena sp. CBHHK59/15]
MSVRGYLSSDDFTDRIFSSVSFAEWQPWSAVAEFEGDAHMVANKRFLGAFGLMITFKRAGAYKTAQSQAQGVARLITGLAPKVPSVFLSVGGTDFPQALLDTTTFIDGLESPPSVLSTSYGAAESMFGDSMAIKLCNAYTTMKLPQEEFQQVIGRLMHFNL